MEMPGFYKDVYHEYMIIDQISTGGDCRFEEQMMHNHELRGLLKFKIEYMNEKCQYYYDIHRMDSIEMQHKENRIHYCNLIDLFSQMRQLLDTLNDYLLTPDNLWLDSMGIYMDRDSQEYMFTYIPGLEKDFKIQFELFVTWLMKIIDHNEKDAVMLIYSLYKRISQETDIISILENIKKDTQEEKILFKKEKAVEKAPHVKEDPPLFVVKEEDFCDKKEDKETVVRKTYIYFGCAVVLVVMGIGLKDILAAALRFAVGIQIYNWAVCGVFLAAASAVTILGIKELLISKSDDVKKGKRDFWDNVQRPDYQTMLNDETTILEAKQMPESKKQLLVLKRQGADNFENDIIYITKVPFIVGKQHDCVQYTLNENTISRRHFKIDFADGVYTIEDMASTNGTWLNDKRLKAHIPYALYHNDTIRAAGIILSVQIKEDV